MQIGEIKQIAEGQNSPKPNRYPYALHLDDLDHRRFIFILDRVDRRRARKQYGDAI